jgi:hypothetical protein
MKNKVATLQKLKLEPFTDDTLTSTSMQICNQEINKEVYKGVILFSFSSQKWQIN